MDRWASCPGSVRLCATIPPTTSVYAEEGTKAHELAAKLLEDAMLGHVAYLSETHPDDMTAAVLQYVRVVRAFIEQDDECKYWIEHKFDLSTIHPGCFGTADFVLHQKTKKKLVVIDYKHGQGIFVSPKNNPQLKYYGLGALLTLPLKDIETVELGICQPRFESSEGAFRSIELTPMDLMDFAHDLKTYAQATEAPDAPLVPGEHCRFCPAAGACPALQEKALALAQQEFRSDLSYNPEELAKALAARETVKAWLKNVDELAYAEMEAGKVIPGWKLVAKRPTRQWKDEALVLTTLKAAGHSDDVIYEPKAIKSPAQMEKALGKAKTILAEHIESVSSGHAIAPEHDPRPAAKLSAKEEFAAIAASEDPFA